MREYRGNVWECDGEMRIFVAGFERWGVFLENRVRLSR